MLDVIAGAFGALKGAADITQGLIALKTDVAVSGKAIELNQIIAGVQQQLFSAQLEFSTVQGRIRELEAELTRFKNWESEKARYQLVELAPSTFVRRLKAEMANGEPVHDVCPNCYEQGMRSILQKNAVVKGHHSFLCPHCQAVFLGEVRVIKSNPGLSRMMI